MYPFLHRVISDRAGKRAIVGRDEIGFDAEALVGALVFHLIDQGHAKSIDPESIETTKRVLSKRLISATVSSSEWAQKDNPARLQWLQEQSAITVNVNESGMGMLVIDECSPPR